MRTLLLPMTAALALVLLSLPTSPGFAQSGRDQDQGYRAMMAGRDRGDDGSFMREGWNDDEGEDSGDPAWHRRMMRHMMMSRGMGAMRPGMMGSPWGRSAVFGARTGNGGFFIRCAPDESTRTCVEATSALLDKIRGLRLGGDSGEAGGAPTMPRP